MKKITAAILAMALLVVSLAGCVGGDSNNNDNTLKITFYNGGYGETWANVLAKKFTEETGIKVELEPNSNLQAEVPNMLQNGTDCDLIFCHNIAWETPAAQGKIELLDDLFESKVDETTFKERLVDSAVEECSLLGHYYKVPWTNGAGGIVYNKKMFEKNGWEVPTTYSELAALCEKIVNDAVPVDATNTKPNAPKIVPFVWSSSTYYWDYVVFDWWVQLAGIEAIEEYKKLESPDVFDPNGSFSAFVQAVEAWKSLVADHPEYSMENSSGKLYTAAQMDFINGYAAMIPCAQWLESEMSDYIGEETCEMALMSTPLMDGAKVDENGEAIRVNYQVGAGDSIIIPSCSQHKKAAKEFLRFLAREENCKLFTEKTMGVMLDFEYSSFDGIENATAFMKDVYTINTTSQKFNLYSQNAMVISGVVSLEWPPRGAQMYASLADRPETSVSESFRSIYSEILQKWAGWQQQAKGE